MDTPLGLTYSQVCDFNLSRVVADSAQLANSGNPNSPVRAARSPVMTKGGAQCACGAALVWALAARLARGLEHALPARAVGACSIDLTNTHPSNTHTHLCFCRAGPARRCWRGSPTVRVL